MLHGVPKKSARLNSFSLVELLVVILIIAILAGLTLAAGEGVMNQAARSRAKSEMQAIATALESYKADNGVYPWTNSVVSTGAFADTNGFATGNDVASSGGAYVVSSQILYQALSGLTNYTDTPVAGIKVYMNFKSSQLGNTAQTSGYSAASSTYVQDPFGYPYGYYASPATATTGAASVPINGQGLFDLWTTGGATLSTANWTNSWISNWAQ
jgi:prepilin-type N-terminal cleavage/methylation domain-containing protein